MNVSGKVLAKKIVGYRKKGGIGKKHVPILFHVIQAVPTE